MTTKIINSLAGLPAEVTVKKLAHRSNYEELWISFPESERVCPHCGSHDCTIKDSSRDYTVYHSASPPQINSPAHAAENATTANPAAVLSCCIRMASSDAPHHSASLHRHLSLTDENAVSQSCRRRKRRIRIYRLLHPRSDQL